MIKKIISITLSFGLLLVATVSLAVPFNSFDPRSMAMGGAGVAVPSPGSAPFFNPALLSIADDSDDFALELPIIGFHLADTNDFMDAVDDFDDTLMDSLDAAITNYNSSPGTSGPVVTALDNVNSSIQFLSNKPVQFDINAGLVVGIPSENFGIALSASAGANFAGLFEYKDGTTVTNLNSDLANLDACYAIIDPILEATCIQTTTFNFVDTDPLSATFGEVIFTAQSDDPNATSNILSQARFIGITVTEVGLTFSRVFNVFGSDWALGLTPKSVAVTVIDYAANADSADTGNLDGDNFTTEYDDFNIDLGAARNFDNGWRMGFVVKNLISYEYEAFNTDPATNITTATGTVIDLKPQARIGLSHTTSFSTVAVDLDLTENEALGSFGAKSQYLALGVEFDAFDFMQLRLGYRSDLVDSDRDIVSAGFGLSPFGVHIDLTVAGNADDVGGSFQFGFRF